MLALLKHLEIKIFPGNSLDIWSGGGISPHLHRARHRPQFSTDKTSLRQNPRRARNVLNERSLYLVLSFESKAVGKRDF